MSQIQSNLPSNRREPGVYHEREHTAGAGGLTPVERRVLLVGIMGSDAAAEAGKIVQAFSESHARELAGDAELYLQARAAFAQARRAGRAMPQVWLLPLEEDGAAAAQVKEITVSGTATEDGEIRWRISGRRLRTPVVTDDDGDTVATALTSTVQEASRILPVTAEVDGTESSQVNATAKWAGITSADIVVDIDEVPAGLTVEVADGAAGTGAIDLSAELDVALDKRYHAIASAQHESDDVTALKEHFEAAAKQKLWGFGYLGETGSLATAQALAPDHFRIVIPAAEGAKSLPSEIAAATAVLAEAFERANQNYNGQELVDIYGPDPGDVWTRGAAGELEAALASGLTPIRPDDQGVPRIVRMYTTQVNLQGVPYEHLRDLGNPRTMDATAQQLDIALTRSHGDGYGDDDTLADIRGTIYGVLKDLEERGWLKNVDQRIDEIIAHLDPSIPTRALTEHPTSVTPILAQIVNRSLMISEA